MSSAERPCGKKTGWRAILARPLESGQWFVYNPWTSDEQAGF